LKRFVSFWPPRYGVPGVRDLFVVGHLAFVDPYEHVHAFDVAKTLEEEGELVHARVVPPVFDVFVRMSDYDAILFNSSSHMLPAAYATWCRCVVGFGFGFALVEIIVLITGFRRGEHQWSHFQLVVSIAVSSCDGS